MRIRNDNNICNNLILAHVVDDKCWNLQFEIWGLDFYPVNKTDVNSKRHYNTQYLLDLRLKLIALEA